MYNGAVGHYADANKALRKSAHSSLPPILYLVIKNRWIYNLLVGRYPDPVLCFLLVGGYSMVIARFLVRVTYVACSLTNKALS